MKHSLYLVLSALLLGACTTTRQQTAHVDTVDYKQSAVKTEAEAIRIALAFVDSTGEAKELKPETAHATEHPDSWRVTIERIVPSRPGIAMVEIAKRTGVAVRIPLR